jgi:hypothetical protein
MKFTTVLYLAHIAMSAPLLGGGGGDNEGLLGGLPIVGPLVGGLVSGLPIVGPLLGGSHSGGGGGYRPPQHYYQQPQSGYQQPQNDYKPQSSQNSNSS